jgi:hypothetical protein
MKHYKVRVFYRYEFEVELDARNDQEAREMSSGEVGLDDRPTDAVWIDSEIISVCE